MLARLLSGIAAIAVLLMMLVLSYNSVVRYIFSAPTAWPGVLTSGVLLPCVIMLPLWYVAKIERHVRIEIFLPKVPARFHGLVARLLALGELGLWVFVTWSLARGLISYLGDAASVGRLSVPRPVTASVLTVGAIGMCLRATYELWAAFRAEQTHGTERTLP